MTSPAGGSPAEVRYETTVVAIGAEVASFVEAGIMVLFGSQAPTELHDISVLHEPSSTNQPPVAGDVLEIAGQRLRLLAVGGAVAANLRELGHASLKADGRTIASLPGDICVRVGPLPLPKVGDVIRVVTA